ncbi:hypothetical protein P3W45_001618 [Vairimorpha bombi]|jgi:hypothetical protein
MIFLLLFIDITICSEFWGLGSRKSPSGGHIVLDSHNNNGSGAGGSAVHHHLGDTNLKAMVITEDVLHKGDGKAYTSVPTLSNALKGGTAKSVDQQIIEMKVGALVSAKESLAAKHSASMFMHKIKQLEAEEKLAKASLLQKQKDEIDTILNSPKEELVKDIMPIIAVTPHSFGFVGHDKLELQRLNDIRMAALKEGDMQKRNALLHERPNNESPMESMTSDPALIAQFYANAPVNKASAVVDPTMGKFSIINDANRLHAHGDGHHRNSIPRGHESGLSGERPQGFSSFSGANSGRGHGGNLKGSRIGNRSSPRGFNFGRDGGFIHRSNK